MFPAPVPVEIVTGESTETFPVPLKLIGLFDVVMERAAVESAVHNVIVPAPVKERLFVDVIEAGCFITSADGFVIESSFTVTALFKVIVPVVPVPGVTLSVYDAPVTLPSVMFPPVV